MKIESLVADVTAIVSVDRSDPAILGVILAGSLFGQFRQHFVVKEPLCDVGTLT